MIQVDYSNLLEMLKAPTEKRTLLDFVSGCFNPQLHLFTLQWFHYLILKEGPGAIQHAIFSGGGNHSPAILTSYKTEVCCLFLASSFYLLAVLEVSGILVLFSRPVVVVRYCFRFNLVFCWQLHFKTNGKLRNPKKGWSCLATFIRRFLPTLLSRGLGGSEVEHSCIWIGGRDDAWCDGSWMDVDAPLFGLLVEDESIYIYRWLGYRWGFQLFLIILAVYPISLGNDPIWHGWWIAESI